MNFFKGQRSRMPRMYLSHVHGRLIYLEVAVKRNLNTSLLLSDEAGEAEGKVPLCAFSSRHRVFNVWFNRKNTYVNTNRKDVLYLVWKKTLGTAMSAALLLGSMQSAAISTPSFIFI